MNIINKKKIVLLIGGGGFVGSAIVELLSKEGYKIVIFSRNAERGNKLKLFGNVGQITSISGNALDFSLLGELIAKCDIIINLVGILSQTKTQTFKNIHSELPEKIGSICKNKNIEKLIHVSSLGASLNSKSVYSRTKAEGERRMLKHFPKAIIFRPSIIFGPGDGFFNRFARMAMFSPALPLIGGGNNKFQPVYINDFSKVVLSSINSNKANGMIFEIGGPKIFNFKELMKLTLKAIQRKRLLISIPFPFFYLPAKLAEFVPNPPITIDQLRLLKYDNICSKKSIGFDFFNIKPLSPEILVEDFLTPYRPGGKFKKNSKLNN